MALLANSADDTVVGVFGLIFIGLGLIVVTLRRSLAGLLQRTLTALGSDLAADMATPRFLLVWGIGSILLGGLSALAGFSTLM
ncbi:MAG: hypothetical protein U0Q03_11250 [Acidimicrobiales bacterium]